MSSSSIISAEVHLYCIYTFNRSFYTMQLARPLELLHSLGKKIFSPLSKNRLLQNHVHNFPVEQHIAEIQLIGTDMSLGIKCGGCAGLINNHSICVCVCVCVCVCWLHVTLVWLFFFIQALMKICSDMQIGTITKVASSMYGYKKIKKHAYKCK